MASRSHATGTFSVALLIAVATASPAIAQTPTPTPATPATPTTPATEMETITVVAPRITYQVRRERGSAIPKEVTVVEETALVNIGDLDLTRTSDLYTLEERLTEAATRVCQTVAAQVPDGQPSTTICTQRAIDDAMAQAQMIVRVANQR